MCDDESEITTRQLARIESGESLPTLIKLRFLAKKLNVTINYLIDDSNIEISNEYLLLKKRIIKQTMYQNSERVNTINNYFDQIYGKYYDTLSEEEQLVIDVLNASVDILSFKDVNFEAGILQEYFEQILLKKEFLEIDFLLIHLYFIYILEKEIVHEEVDTINKIVIKLIENSSFSNSLNAYLTIQVQIPALHILSILNEYKLYKLLLNTVALVSRENQEFQKLPIIQMMEAKYLLLYEKNISEAKKMYEKASQTALLLGDEHLQKQVLFEFNQDLNKIN